MQREIFLTGLGGFTSLKGNKLYKIPLGGTIKS
jgi:hypothetical protein